MKTYRAESTKSRAIKQTKNRYIVSNLRELGKLVQERNIKAL